MASTVGIVSKAVQPDEAVLNGIERSRYSLHLITSRVRHWIQVHLASVPVQAEETTSVPQVHPIGSQTTMGRLMDDYMATLFIRRWA